MFHQDEMGMRIPPISAGGNVGHFEGQIPTMTLDAIAGAFRNLDQQEQEVMQQAEFKLCIFKQTEWQEYEKEVNSKLSQQYSNVKEELELWEGKCNGTNTNEPWSLLEPHDPDADTDITHPKIDSLFSGYDSAPHRGRLYQPSPRLRLWQQQRAIDQQDLLTRRKKFAIEGKNPYDAMR